MKISAALKVQGATVDTDEISQSIGHKPTTVRRAPWNANLSVWEIRTPFIETLDVMPPLGELMSLISSEAGKKLADLALAQSAEFELSIVVYRNTLVGDTTPILHFDKSALQWISSIRADLDVDIIEMAREYETSK